MATAPQPSDAMPIDEATTVPPVIDVMVIAAMVIAEMVIAVMLIAVMAIDAIATCAVTPTDAKSTPDSPKASFRTPIRSIWIAKTKGCSMTNQKSPTIHREAIGTETPRSLPP
ncbi:MAG: hypothetical protein NT168_08615, partial [Planctomycetota bacterium]|nr:hypothetical protein [Planctomycetota bacterium]